MALIPKIEACVKDCSTLEIKDVTGFYNVTTNPTGWGTPNLARDFVGNATLEVKIGGVVTQYNVKSIIENSVFPIYLLQEITSLVDGIITISLTLVDTVENVTYKTQIKITNECDVTCCVAKLAVKALSGGCSDLPKENFEEAELLLSTLPYIAKNLGEDAYNKNLKRLQKICSSTDCGCGCS